MKTASPFSRSKFISYPIHAVFLNMRTSKENSYSKMATQYTVPSSLLVWMCCRKWRPSLRYERNKKDGSAVQSALDDDVRLTSSSDGKEQNMLFLQESVTQALNWMGELTHLGFEVLKRPSEPWNGFQTILSYCSDIVEVKSVPAVKMACR